MSEHAERKRAAVAALVRQRVAVDGRIVPSAGAAVLLAGCDQVAVHPGSGALGRHVVTPFLRAVPVGAQLSLIYRPSFRQLKSLTSNPHRHHGDRHPAHSGELLQRLHLFNSVVPIAVRITNQLRIPFGVVPGVIAARTVVRPPRDVAVLGEPDCETTVRGLKSLAHQLSNLTVTEKLAAVIPPLVIECDPYALSVTFAEGARAAAEHYDARHGGDNMVTLGRTGLYG